MEAADIEHESGKENLETIVLKIEWAGWPNLECKSEGVVLRLVMVEWKAFGIGKEIGHSYSSFDALPWSNGTPDLRSFT